jgi:Ulp1 family protease
MKRLQCSPNPKKKDFSCFSDESIHQLRDMWNARHPDTSISSNDSREIWTTLKENLKNVCNKESCWLRQNFVGTDKSKKLMEESFAPQAPKSWKKKPNEWLSSMDILRVMKQYEKAYKCFEFMGPSPIDYDTKEMYGECVWEELCNFNLKEQMDKGKFKIGVTFNLDPHYKGGSHWVSLFINTRKKMIFYFDSAGEKIPSRIMKFVKTVTAQGKALGIDFKFDQNYPVEHQYQNTECGIYSIFFIAHMLEDKINEHYLKTHVLKDKYMSKFRKIYFNDSAE